MPPGVFLNKPGAFAVWVCIVMSVVAVIAVVLTTTLDNHESFVGCETCVSCKKHAMQSALQPVQVMSNGRVSVMQMRGRSSTIGAAYVFGFNQLPDSLLAQVPTSRTTVLFPYSYDTRDVNDLFRNAEATPSTTINAAIINADAVVAKDSMWEHVLQKYGLECALRVFPDTFVLADPASVQRLKSNHCSGKVYILKKNTQRQTGLLITQDVSFITSPDARMQRYVVAQELLDNPYLIDGHKTNLRFYVLVILDDTRTDVYVHKEGFVYYAPEVYSRSSQERNVHITSGYIDRRIYDRNPLTLSDFAAHIDQVTASARVFGGVYKLIACVFSSVSFQNKADMRSFQVFGVDVAVLADGSARIMEVNKGADFGFKDSRDGAVKTHVARDVWTLVLGSSERNHNVTGFVRVL